MFFLTSPSPQNREKSIKIKETFSPKSPPRISPVVLYFVGYQSNIHELLPVLYVNLTIVIVHELSLNPQIFCA